jgi:hypothetical protein
MFPSVNPAKSLVPKAFQAREVQIGNLVFLGFYSEDCYSLGLVTGVGKRVWTGLWLREMRFQILIPDSVAAATH